MSVLPRHSSRNLSSLLIDWHKIWILFAFILTTVHSDGLPLLWTNGWASWMNDHNHCLYRRHSNRCLCNNNNNNNQLMMMLYCHRKKPKVLLVDKSGQLTNKQIIVQCHCFFSSLFVCFYFQSSTTIKSSCQMMNLYHQNKKEIHEKSTVNPINPLAPTRNKPFYSATKIISLSGQCITWDFLFFRAISASQQKVRKKILFLLLLLFDFWTSKAIKTIYTRHM